MKKIIFVLIMSFCVTLIACGGGQPTGDPNEAWVRAANAELATYSLGGFAYKQANLPPAAQWNAWFKTTGPVLQKILSETPDGYVLQVTGHACERGPEDQEGAKPGNIKLSNDRAKNVYDALIRNKIDSPKLTHRGVSTQIHLEGVDPRDAKQRRVSFRIVQQ